MIWFRIGMTCRHMVPQISRSEFKQTFNIPMKDTTIMTRTIQLKGKTTIQIMAGNHLSRITTISIPAQTLILPGSIPIVLSV
ncbi:MAG: hypothetical protein R6U78_04925 [Bacteroidales bacterium]